MIEKSGGSCSLEKIAEFLKGAKRVAIFTHMRPDGDAYGSSLALKTALENIGVDCEVCDETDAPSNLLFMDGVDEVKKKPTAPYDVLIALDCADEQRLGLLAEEFRLATKEKKITINVDHHVSNTRFAKYNFVRCCAANCMNVAKLVEYLGAPFDKKTAEYLLMGLLTDSGNFSHDDVDEECLLLAAKLVKSGADIKTLTYELFKKQPKERAALFADVMAKHGADNGMTEGFVDFPLSVDTVEVAASVMEVKKGQYKISLRSKDKADVNKIAGVYGGGGHVKAAGCMLFGEVEEVLDKLSYTVSQYLE